MRTLPPLDEFQLQGILWLAARRRALLLDDPGLGKTPQLVRAAARLYRRAKAQGRGAEFRLLVTVAPSVLRYKWESELLRWGHDDWSAPGVVTVYDPDDQGAASRRPDAAIHVMTYPALSQNAHVAWLRSIPWAGIIIDEAQALRRTESDRTIRMLGPLYDGARGLISCAREFVWAATGSPIIRDITDIWPLLRAIVPDALPRNSSGWPVNQWQFLDLFADYVVDPYGRTVVRKLKNVELFLSGVAPYILRRTEADINRIIPLRYEDLPITVKRSALDELARLAPTDIRLVDYYARRLLDGETPEQGPAIASLLRMAGMIKARACAWIVSEWLTSGRVAKIVVWGWHVDALGLFADELILATGYNPGVVMVHGGTTRNETAFAKFQRGDARVFVGQIASAGVGEDLDAAHVCLMLEQSPLPEFNRQAVRRLCRVFTQKNHVLAYVARLRGSAEDAVTSAIRRRTAQLLEIGLLR